MFYILGKANKSFKAFNLGWISGAFKNPMQGLGR
jgi:hypothetical protein